MAKMKKNSYLKKIILKYGKKIEVDTFDFKGVVKIVGYREYLYHHEFDIEISGTLWCRYRGNLRHHNLEELKDASTRSLNKRLRRCIESTIQRDFLMFFGIRYFDIKKITRL